MPRLTMPTAAIIAAFHLQASACAAEETKPFGFKLRYAVVLDGAEPFKGEVTCWSNQECVIVDHKQPDIRLKLPRTDSVGSYRALYVDCQPRNCVLWPERPVISPRQEPQLNTIQLSEGESPSQNAVALSRRRIGDIFIAY
jgi:hypothetical protein